MTEIQDFIEKFYPDYSNSDEIAYLNDLNKLVEGDYEDGDSADILLQRVWYGHIESNLIPIEQQKQYIRVLEKAIESFINNESLANKLMPFQKIYDDAVHKIQTEIKNK